MVQHVARRLPFRHEVDPFTERTYALVDAYTKATDGPTLEHAFVGDASAIILACDVMLERGLSSWDDCTVDVARAMFALGFGWRARTMVQAVLAFRRWLHTNGHASDAGIDALAELAAESEDSEPPPAIEFGEVGARPNRSERRWQARVDRRARRR